MWTHHVQLEADVATQSGACKAMWELEQAFHAGNVDLGKAPAPTEDDDDVALNECIKNGFVPAHGAMGEQGCEEQCLAHKAQCAIIR